MQSSGQHFLAPAECPSEDIPVSEEQYITPRPGHSIIAVGVVGDRGAMVEVINDYITVALPTLHLRDELSKAASSTLPERMSRIPEFNHHDGKPRFARPSQHLEVEPLCVDLQQPRTVREFGAADEAIDSPHLNRNRLRELQVLQHRPFEQTIEQSRVPLANS